MRERALEKHKEGGKRGGGRHGRERDLPARSNNCIHRIGQAAWVDSEVDIKFMLASIAIVWLSLDIWYIPVSTMHIQQLLSIKLLYSAKNLMCAWVGGCGNRVTRIAHNSGGRRL